MSKQTLRQRAAFIALLVSLGWCASAVADETVQVCGSFGNNVFTSGTVAGITATARCPTPSYNGGGFGLFNSGKTTLGQTGRWQTVAAAGLELVGATANQIVAAGVNAGTAGDFGGGFYWAGGGAAVNGSTPASAGWVFPSPSRYFGMQLICGKSTCTQPATFAVGAFSLYVRETSGPGFSAPSGLWPTTGWIRGTWPFVASGDSPSGLCSLSATLNGQLISTTTSGRDLSSWHQCAAAPISQLVDTTRYGQGAVPLTLSAGDAAGVPASMIKTIYIDNAQPTVSISGPTDAPSTAGTQYVTATASGGPSGIAGISCSVDSQPARWYPGASASVPVSGIGDHPVSCSAASNAVDPAGNHGWSSPANWTLSIREPTVSGIGFGHLVDAPLCHRVRERVSVPAHWVSVRRHHKLVRIKKTAHSRVVTATRCHARVVRRTITVWKTVTRHGKKVRVKRHKTIKVVELPHVVMHSSELVGYDRRTIVSGWLGTSDGTALGGQVVRVLTAPDDELGQFTSAAVTTTAADGAWSAQLPVGPSRLVEAYYAGAPTFEPSVSAQVRVIVPANVKLISVRPRRVAWGGTVRITGQLLGGYLPTGGALVRLRIGQASNFQTYGVQEHVTGNGRFTTAYTFGAGYAGIYRSYWFQIATLPMGNYPYAPASSRRQSVLVGGSPA